MSCDAGERDCNLRPSGNCVLLRWSLEFAALCLSFLFTLVSPRWPAALWLPEGSAQTQRVDNRTLPSTEKTCLKWGDQTRNY